MQNKIVNVDGMTFISKPDNIEINIVGKQKCPF